MTEEIFPFSFGARVSERASTTSQDYSNILSLPLFLEITMPATLIKNSISQSKNTIQSEAIEKSPSNMFDQE
jgi:hypothetical protein